MITIFTDLDGTFYSGVEIPQENIDTYWKLKQKGHKVILATGRSLKAVKDIFANHKDLQQFSFFPGVYDNGCVIYGEGGEILASFKILSRIVRVILNFWLNHRKKSEFNFSLYIDDCAETYELNVHSVIGAPLEPQPHAVGNLILDRCKEEYTGYCRAVFILNPSVQEEIRAELHALLKEEVLITSTGKSGLFEVLPGATNKGKGVRVIMDKYGFKKEDTLAIGDAENDLSMFDEVNVTCAMLQSNLKIRNYTKLMTDKDCCNAGWACFMKSYFF